MSQNIRVSDTFTTLYENNLVFGFVGKALNITSTKKCHFMPLHGAGNWSSSLRISNRKLHVQTF